MAVKVVIDTNVLVASLSSRSVHHWLIEWLLQGKLRAFVTDEIMLEYEEILTRKYSPIVASHFLKALHELPNVLFTHIFYRWNLLADPDDNKFVDCFVAANAEYLISHDTDFNKLQFIEFPKVTTVTIDGFKQILSA